MKRSVIAGVAALAMVGLVGCSAGSAQSPDSDGKTGTLRVIDPWFPTNNQGAADFDKVVQRFHEKYPNVEVQRDTASFGDLSQKITTSVTSGQNYDVVMSGFAWIPPLVSLGAIQPLDDLGVSREQVVSDIGEKNAGFVATASYEDQIYAYPLTATGRAVAYSKKAFKEAGLDPEKPPTSLAEVREYANKLTVKDGSGTITLAGFDFKSTASNYRQSFVGVLGALGEPLYVEGTTPNFGGSAGEQSLDWMAGMISDGTSTFGAVDPSNVAGVYLGKAGMGFADTYVDCSDKGIGQEKCDDLGFFSLADKKPAMFVGGALASVGAGTQLPEAALAFVQALRSEDSLQAIAKAQNLVPLSPSPESAKFAKANPASAFFITHTQDAVFEGGPTNWLELRGIFGPTIDGVLLKKTSPREALDTLTQAASQ